jgi:hypothetical protein
MRCRSAVLVVIAALVPVLFRGQASTTKHVVLSPKSNVDTASVAEGFAKYCPNVLVTENESKADFVLEASGKTTYSDGDSSTQWHFTLLSKDGDVLMTTHPEFHLTHARKHHFEAVCKYINEH